MVINWGSRHNYQACLLWLGVSIFCFLNPNQSYALTFSLPDAGDNIVGEVRIIKVAPDQTIYSIARENDVGITELLAANPQIKGHHLKAGAKIIIPTARVLPDAPRNGIIINLPEMRLYYFSPYRSVVMTFPIGIGREGWETPLQETTVLSKEEAPFWYPPESIRNYSLRNKGVLLGKVVSPGPDNPLGDYAIHLALIGYLIHGTNQPYSVGKRSSSGCIRMYPEDIQQLFYQINPGTPVYIIHQPYKLGRYHNEYYLEIHEPLPGYNQSASALEMIQVATQNKKAEMDWQRISETISHNMGFPILIGQGA
jgi:L,D-transpeptidase ErfK/SrfK